ncbi:SAM-dependent methyltransferase [Streptacidiphilus cavernicola]|uniref:SAM-dependent methyltransferase n=1 Tax=Streptacidiphilus cavernicola TaxID=3342716 RepID=A0ABV6VPS9_9ACTN
MPQDAARPEPERTVPGATTARFYDKYLGGGHAREVEARAAEQVLAAMPELPAVLKANLAFVQRSVHYLAGIGVEGFLDLGAGIPTIDNIHEIVPQQARTVYVDNDPLVVRERQLQTNAATDRAASVHGDLRDPAAIMADPDVVRLLDPSGPAPIAILMASVLHFVTDDQQAADILAAYHARLPAGSYLVLSHAALKPGAEERMNEAIARYSRLVAPMKLRSAEELAALIPGFRPVEPGIVPCTHWRPNFGDNPGPLADALPQLGLVAQRV